MKISNKSTTVSVVPSHFEEGTVALDIWPADGVSGVYVRLTPKEARKLAKRLKRVANKINPNPKVKTLVDGDGDTWYLNEGEWTMRANGIGWATKDHIREYHGIKGED